MASALAELVKAASGPISRTPQRLRDVPVTVSKERLLELESLLHLRDGFRTLDNALIIRPSTTVAAVRSVDAWNQFSLWRGPYTHASEVYFFAGTVGGVQFGIYKDEIMVFEPGTAKVEHFAFKLERFAQRVLEEPERIERATAVAWQDANGPLVSHERLAPLDPTSPVSGDPTQWVKRTDVDLMRRWTKFFAATAQASASVAGSSDANADAAGEIETETETEAETEPTEPPAPIDLSFWLAEEP